MIIPETLIPIVSVLAVFGAPVVMYLGKKYFALREKELALEAEARQWAERHAEQIEARMQRLESVILALDPAKLSAQHGGLMEPPAAAPHEPFALRDPKMRTP